MHDSTLSQSPAVPPALLAFLRGVERRAFVFLWLQSGHAGQAEQALAAAFRAFRAKAAQQPMAEWPGMFWRRLALLPETAGGDWPAPLAWFGTLDLSPRRALLLRLAGGLREDEAAAALSIPVADYEQALAAACPRDAAGQVDVDAWRGLADAVQQVLRDLSLDQLTRLSDLREQALQPVPSEIAAARPQAAEADTAASPRPRRRRWPWVVLIALACVLALLATWSPSWTGLPGAVADEVRSGDDLRVHDTGPITVEELPAHAGPLPEPALPAAVPEPPADPVVARMDLLSWYAAGAPASRLEREAGTEPPPPPALPPAPAPALEVDGAALEAAWAGLDAVEQAQLREASLAFAALDGQQQLTLQAGFAALDRMERAGWRLGPAVGADYPALQPLLGYVPADERDALLKALRQLGPEARVQLAVLTQRTPAQERDALRRELLAQAPAQRSTWLAQRLR